MFGSLDLVTIKKKRKRVGRGGSRGKTSGRGMKGQLARSGGRSEIKPFFEGGQMSLSRRMPRKGFKSSVVKYDVVNLERLNEVFADGDQVDLQKLKEAGIVKGGNSQKKMIKILGFGVIEKKLQLTVNAISKSAKEAVEKVGGTVTILGV